LLASFGDQGVIVGDDNSRTVFFKHGIIRGWTTAMWANLYDSEEEAYSDHAIAGYTPFGILAYLSILPVFSGEGSY
jgi:hypothetical protein